MAKYLTRRIKRNITRAIIVEYSNNELYDKIVNGNVYAIIRISNNDKIPLTSILRKYFCPKSSPFFSSSLFEIVIMARSTSWFSFIYPNNGLLKIFNNNAIILILINFFKV